MKTAEQIGAELAGCITGQVSVDIYNRIAFSTDASMYRIVPQCVVSARNEADIIAVICYAAENHIPVVPRGAGSGIAGESLTSGIVLDVRRYMHSIIQTADDGSWVRVQPGVVLDQLNMHLSKWHRKIGPDPSSSNRAVMGGVVANNSTGAHSLQYGYIADYVQSVRSVLADGNCCEFTDHAESSTDRAQGRYAKACWELLADKQELINKAQPATQRNRCGYTIQDIICGSEINLAKLMAGSEGTLAVFTEITLRTVPVPKAKGLVQFEFSNSRTMAQAVPVLVDCGVSACELMDGKLIGMARQAFPEYHSVLPDGCAATLLVELTGDDRSQVNALTDKAIKAVNSLATGHLKVLDENKQAFLWKARKDAVPLLNREKGDTHPVAFIEDISVQNNRLDEYVAGLEQMGRKYDIPIAFYGHAGDGELHVRPYLDLSRQDEVDRMRQIAGDVFELAWSLGGTISGEHGDGLLRAGFIEAQYGHDYYQLLRGVKQIFDPDGILNPGKIINDDPDVMVKNLRAVQLKAADDFQTDLNFQPNEFFYEAAQCDGCGVCLAQTVGSRMCPIFRGLNQELGSSRAKANLLSAWMAGQFREEDFFVEDLKDVLGLCVNCKMCTIDCPAGVDISKIIIEVRAQLAQQTGFTAAELALSHNRWLSVLASTFSPLSNWIMSWPITRWALEKIIGLDQTRRFPHFDRGSFIRKGQRRLKKQPPLHSPADRVVYFVDSYANWNDHELGFAVLDIFEKLRIKVLIPRQRPVPLPAYVYGNLKTARRDIDYNLKHIARFARWGYKIICSEPSAALCLKDEMRMLNDSEEARIVTNHTFELMDYLYTLAEQEKGLLFENKKSLRTAFAGKRLAYHAPCHLKCMRMASRSIELLQRCGLDIVDINGGCCGLAGTAGMQKKHHDLSDAVGARLVSKIEECSPDIILTECAACKMQIEHMIGIEVLHPVKLLALAL